MRTASGQNPRKLIGSPTNETESATGGDYVTSRRFRGDKGPTELLADQAEEDSDSQCVGEYVKLALIADKRKSKTWLCRKRRRRRPLTYDVEKANALHSTLQPSIDPLVNVLIAAESAYEEPVTSLIPEKPINDVCNEHSDEVHLQGSVCFCGPPVASPGGSNAAVETSASVRQVSLGVQSERKNKLTGKDSVGGVVSKVGTNAAAAPLLPCKRQENGREADAAGISSLFSHKLSEEVGDTVCDFFSDSPLVDSHGLSTQKPLTSPPPRVVSPPSSTESNLSDTCTPPQPVVATTIGNPAQNNCEVCAALFASPSSNSIKKQLLLSPESADSCCTYVRAGVNSAAEGSLFAHVNDAAANAGTSPGQSLRSCSASNTASEPATLFAVKEIPRHLVTSHKQAQRLWGERLVLERLAAHPAAQCGVVRLEETFKTPESLCFVFEAVLGGPLHKHIRFEGGFSLERTRWYAAELLLTLRSLHAHGVLYRDLQASNVVLDDAGRLKLVDFGFAKDFGSPAKTHRAYSFCGTIHAMAPEVFAQQRISSSASKIGHSNSNGGDKSDNNRNIEVAAPSTEKKGALSWVWMGGSSPKKGGLDHFKNPFQRDNATFQSDSVAGQIIEGSVAGHPHQQQQQHFLRSSSFFARFRLVGSTLAAECTGKAKKGQQQHLQQQDEQQQHKQVHTAAEGNVSTVHPLLAAAAGREMIKAGAAAFPSKGVVLEAMAKGLASDSGGAHEVSGEGENETKKRAPGPQRREVIQGEEWTPEEVGEGYSFAADWWSFGILIFEMLYNTVPFGYQDNDRERGTSIQKLAERSPLTLSFPADRRVADDAKQLIIELLQANPEQRLGYRGAEEVMKHPFFKDVDWKIVENIRREKNLSQESLRLIPEAEKALGLLTLCGKRETGQRRKNCVADQNDPFADF